MKMPSSFLGTYFDRDDVLRLERLVKFVARAALVVYGLEAGYNAYQSFYNAFSGSYPLDWYLLITTISRLFQGVVIFVFLSLSARALLILLDIEDNTRRAASSHAAERRIED